MSVKIDNILNQVREKGNMGGIAQIVYFGLLEDFETLAETPDPSVIDVTFGDVNKLSVGQDILKPGKRLYKLYSTLEQGSLNSERQGGTDYTSHKISLQLFNPGLTSEALGLLRIPNQNFILYVKSGKQMFRVGSKDFPAKLSPEGNVGTGDATSSEKGNRMTFFSYDVGPAPEVTNITNIENMLIATDPNLTTTFNPVHGATTADTTVTPTITFSKSVISANTGNSIDNAELDNIVTFNELDLDGNIVGEVTFTATISSGEITVTPSSSLKTTTLYELSFDETAIVAADTGGRVNNASYARFTTA